MHLYPINGACHRVGADETAFAFRHATFSTVIVCAWPDPAKDGERIQWVRDYYQAIAPYSEPGGYVNFMADGRPGPGAGELRRPLHPSDRGQAGLRPRQPVPPQSEHSSVQVREAVPLPTGRAGNLTE